MAAFFFIIFGSSYVSDIEIQIQYANTQSSTKVLLFFFLLLLLLEKKKAMRVRAVTARALWNISQHQKQSLVGIK